MPVFSRPGKPRARGRAHAHPGSLLSNFGCLVILVVMCVGLGGFTGGGGGLGGLHQLAQQHGRE